MKGSTLKTILWVLLLMLPAVAGHAGSILFDAAVVAIYVWRKPRILLKDCLVLLAPVALAVVIGLARGYAPYAVFKDVFYLITPVVALMTGEIWSKSFRPAGLLSFLIRIGTIFSLVSIVTLLLQHGPAVLVSPRSIRDMADTYASVNAVAVISFSILLYCIIYHIRLKGKYLLAAVNFVALYLSGSRSFYLVVLVYALYICYPLYRRSRVLFISAAAFAALSVGSLLVFAPSENQMVSMILHSTEEMKIQDYTTMADVNSNYRGYEAFCALVEYGSFPPACKVFGGGCGQLVDLGDFSPFEFSEIPILHNGYPYFLVKIGVVGLLVFLLYFIFRYIGLHRHLRRYRRYGRLSRLLIFMSCAGVLSLWIMQASVNALFNFDYIAPLYVVSATLCYLRRGMIARTPKP